MMKILCLILILLSPISAMKEEHSCEIERLGHKENCWVFSIKYNPPYELRLYDSDGRFMLWHLHTAYENYESVDKKKYYALVKDFVINNGWRLSWFLDGTFEYDICSMTGREFFNGYFKKTIDCGFYKIFLDDVVEKAINSLHNDSPLYMISSSDIYRGLFKFEKSGTETEDPVQRHLNRLYRGIIKTEAMIL